MAITIAKYEFDNSNDYENAKDRINKEVGSYSYNGWNYNDSYYYIYIDDSCEKASLIGQICRAHGGKSIS
jgi:hypothetical protein